MEVSVFTKPIDNNENDFLQYAKQVVGMYAGSELEIIYDKLQQYKQKLKLREYPRIQLNNKSSGEKVIAIFFSNNNSEDIIIK